MSYQWQYSTDSGTTWKNNSGDKAKTATFSIAANATRYGYEYRCMLTGDADAVLYTDSVKIIGPMIINGVTYAALADDATKCKVVSYSGDAASVVIPEIVNGMTVTRIGEEAFMGNTTLTSIDLPDTIVVIEARAFKGCTNLSSMS